MVIVLNDKVPRTEQFLFRKFSKNILSPDLKIYKSCKYINPVQSLKKRIFNPI